MRPLEQGVLIKVLSKRGSISLEQVSLASCAWRCDQHGKGRPNVGAQGRAVGRRRQHLVRCGALSFDAVPCLSTRCPVSRCGGLSFDALPSQLICANLRVWQRGASAYAVSATPRRSVYGHLEQKGSFGRALLGQHSLSQWVSGKTFPRQQLPAQALDAFLHL
jgi:hypothetical protein